MGFSQALSGLNAASSNLNVVSNNIANSQTVGFKSSTTLFADVYAGARIGMGTRVADVMQNFQSGNLETTDRALDLAISGSGFLRLNQGGQVIYSRNGQLTLTPEGYLENAQRARLMGANGIIQIPAGGLQAKATDEVAMTLNLDSGSAPITTAPFDATDPDTYSYANTARVYDSLGNAHESTLYFVKTDTNSWEMHVALDGTVPADQTPQVIAFNSNGLLEGYAASAFDFPMSNGANTISFELDLTGTTQFDNDFEVSSLNQSGYTSGSLTGITVEENGNIVGNYSNEQTQVLAQIQLASFRSPEGLSPIGDNGWVETAASGQALIGTAGVGQLGSIRSGVVESSNVELTRELVNLIIAQRSFQANAQSVKTQSDVLEQAVNLNR